METRGGRVHHAYGRCAPYIRNSRTIHAVPMHHHPRFCCSLGAAYAFSCTIFSGMVCYLLSNGVSQLHSTRDLQTMSLFIYFSICEAYSTLSAKNTSWSVLVTSEIAKRYGMLRTALSCIYFRLLLRPTR